MWLDSVGPFRLINWQFVQLVRTNVVEQLSQLVFQEESLRLGPLSLPNRVAMKYIFTYGQ